MIKESFQSDWLVYPLGEDDPKTIKTDLPYDAMLREERSSESAGGVNSAWFLCKDYAYEKEFEKPEIEAGGQAILRFGGVYRNAEIYLNDEKIHENRYGYNTFSVDLTKHLKEGKNKIKVIAHNSDQPNSRWYSGTGIYRPVHLFLLPAKRIEYGSLRVETLDASSKKIRVYGRTSCDGEIVLSILDKEGKSIFKGSFQSEGKSFSQELSLEGSSLWSAEHPNLYTLKVGFFGHDESLRFGIREIRWGTEGFLINGERLLLKGACMHHDNGPLGAESYRDVEFRKAALLKKAGYNAIRSAHNPVSEDFLDACDELGLYVMDEYVDCWYIHKTKYDYVNELKDHWPEDLQMMVEKDFSHPSVVLYSIGNEVAETSEKKGIELTRQLANKLRELDPTRPITCGVNIFFNALYSMGFGVYSDKKAENNKQAKAKKKETGSAFFNKITNMLGSNVMKVGSTLPICDRKTRDSFAHLDAPGYNYAIFRYKHDLKKYKERLIVGSETFCSDARWFIDFAKGHPRVIGDFVWAGIDYLGECGIGAWASEDDAPSFGHDVGWICAGSGRIDITGKFLGEALYTQVMFGTKPIELAVVAPRESEVKHSPSAWKFSMAMPYYDFPGQEGKKATAEVYSLSKRVALNLNGKRIGKKKVGKNGRAIFRFAYQPGVLEAINLDEDGNEKERICLRSGGPRNCLTIHPETEHPSPNDRLWYIRFALGDEKGNIRPYLKDELEITDVKGGRLKAFANGNAYNAEGYLTNRGLTYQGEALAIFVVDDEKAFSFTVKSQYGEGRLSK